MKTLQLVSVDMLMLRHEFLHAFIILSVYGGINSDTQDYRDNNERPPSAVFSLKQNAEVICQGIMSLLALCSGHRLNATQTHMPDFREVEFAVR